MVKESEFLKMCDIVDELRTLTDGYYPTVDELKAHKVEENIEKYLLILVYYANDPLTRAGSDTCKEEDYKETVSYCKRLVYTVNPIPDMEEDEEGE